MAGNLTLVIQDGTIVDGTGREPFVGDITIVNDRIHEIHNNEEGRESPAIPAAAHRIDASGKLVVPGFIDTHIHSDLNLLWDRQHAPSLHQGVTTHLLAQDGFSYAPLGPENLKMYKQYLSGISGNYPLGLEWESVAEFRALFDERVAVNTLYQVPHGALRLETIGMANRTLDPPEMAAAKSLLRTGLEEGATGLSTGLSYFPASYARTDELIDLCRVVAEHNGVFVVHLRSVFWESRFDPLEEALTIARESGCKLHVSHFRTAPNLIGKVDELLAPLDEAVEDGLPVTFDVYPYAYGSGHAVILLPPWAVEGGAEQTLARLADPSLRPALVEGIQENEKFADMVFTHVPSMPEIVGSSFDEAKQRLGAGGIAGMICDILLRERLEVGMRGNVSALKSAGLVEQFDDDFLQLIQRPYAMVGSDGIFVGRNPHPRGYGAFARALRLARDAGVPVQDTVRTLAAVPAETFGVANRGRLAAGDHADIVVLDHAEIRDTADETCGRRLATGVEHVLVNGTPALNRYGVTGLFAGRALRPAWSSNATSRP